MNLILSAVEEKIMVVEPDTDKIRVAKRNFEVLFVRGDGVILVSLLSAAMIIPVIMNISGGTSFAIVAHRSRCPMRRLSQLCNALEAQDGGERENRRTDTRARPRSRSRACHFNCCTHTTTQYTRPPAH
jgi:hypothetical protein